MRSQLGGCNVELASGTIDPGKDLEETFSGTTPFDSCNLLAYLGR